MEVNSWRTQLCPKTRKTVVDKVCRTVLRMQSPNNSYRVCFVAKVGHSMDTCKKLVPSSKQQALSEVEKIAIDFEAKIYSAATSQEDYLQQVSKKMLIVERNFQNTESNSAGSNASPIDDIISDPGTTKMEVTNQRVQFGLESRGKVVNKIVDLLRKHIPFSREHPLSEIKKIAMKFEEKIYKAATSQDDYLRKISIKMLTLEKISQDAVSNSSGSSSFLTASQNIQSQLNIQRQPLTFSAAKHSPAHLQNLLQNTPNGIASPGVQGSSTSLPLARPATSGSSQVHMANVSAENFNPKSISEILQGLVGNSMAQEASPNISVNHLKLLQQDSQQGLTSHEGSFQKQLPQVLKQFENEIALRSVQTNTEQGCLRNQLELSQPPNLSSQQCDRSVHNFLPLQQLPNLIGRHQDQLFGQQSNVCVVQQNGQKLVYGNSCMRQDEVALQGHTQHSASALFPVQGQHSQPYLEERQLLLHSQNLRQSPNPSQPDMEPRLKTPDGTPMKGQSNLEESEKEEVSAKVEHMKSKYFPKLREMFKLATADLQCYGMFCEEEANPEHVEKLKKIRQMIGIYLFLNNPKSIMDKAYEERLGGVEHTIISLLKAFGRQNPLTLHHNNLT